MLLIGFNHMFFHFGFCLFVCFSFTFIQERRETEREREWMFLFQIHFGKWRKGKDMRRINKDKFILTKWKHLLIMFGFFFWFQYYGSSSSQPFGWFDKIWFDFFFVSCFLKIFISRNDGSFNPPSPNETKKNKKNYHHWTSSLLIIMFSTKKKKKKKSKKKKIIEKKQQTIDFFFGQEIEDYFCFQMVKNIVHCFCSMIIFICVI